MNLADAYRVLGLSPDADLGAVRRAFQRLARRNHPRLASTTADDLQFRLVTEAYEVLLQGSADGAAGRLSRRFVTQAVFFGPDDSPTLNPEVPCVECELVIEISLSEAIFGTVASATWQREERCAPCSGAGCSRCGLRGVRVRLERMRATVPAGTEDGACLRLVRRGAEGAPELRVRVKVRPHFYFRREDLDIYAELPVTYAEAALGSEVDVPTIHGAVRVRIPPGTSGGSRFRLMGMGVRRAERAGDHYYSIVIAVPKQLTELERELIERLPQSSPRERLPKALID